MFLLCRNDSLIAQLARLSFSADDATIGRRGAMDTDTSEPIETPSSKTRRPATLTERIDNVESSLPATIDSGDSVLDDIKRHMDVVAKGLRADLRLIAQSIDALNVKIDSLRR
jgi:hypothetical protein